MSELRAKPADLCMSDAMPFMQAWQYRTTHPIADLLNGDFFRPVQSMLRPGDSITICRFDAQDGNLLEFVSVRVASSAPDAVRIIKAGDIVRVEKPAPVAAPEADRVYSVKKQFGGGFLVEDDKGNVVEQFKTKIEAEAFAADLSREAA